MKGLFFFLAAFAIAAFAALAIAAWLWFAAIEERACTSALSWPATPDTQQFIGYCMQHHAAAMARAFVTGIFAAPPSPAGTCNPGWSPVPGTHKCCPNDKPNFAPPNTCSR